MQYYTFVLDEESTHLTTIVKPFGNYLYNVLPMGLKCSPDFVQETMKNIFRNINDTKVYIHDTGAFSPNLEHQLKLLHINDIGALSPNWEHHLKLLCIILTKLQENGFTVNMLKYNWALKETDLLGYWLMPTGLKPWKKKNRCSP